MQLSSIINRCVQVVKSGQIEAALGLVPQANNPASLRSNLSQHHALWAQISQLVQDGEVTAEEMAEFSDQWRLWLEAIVYNQHPRHKVQVHRLTEDDCLMLWSHTFGHFQHYMAEAFPQGESAINLRRQLQQKIAEIRIAFLGCPLDWTPWVRRCLEIERMVQEWAFVDQRPCNESQLAFGVKRMYCMADQVDARGELLFPTELKMRRDEAINHLDRLINNLKKTEVARLLDGASRSAAAKIGKSAKRRGRPKTSDSEREEKIAQQYEASDLRGKPGAYACQIGMDEEAFNGLMARVRYHRNKARGKSPK